MAIPLLNQWVIWTCGYYVRPALLVFEFVALLTPIGPACERTQALSPSFHSRKLPSVFLFQRDDAYSVLRALRGSSWACGRSDQYTTCWVTEDSWVVANRGGSFQIILIPLVLFSGLLLRYWGTPVETDLVPPEADCSELKDLLPFLFPPWGYL